MKTTHCGARVELAERCLITERERDALAALHAEVVAEADRLKALLQSVVDRAHEEALREARVVSMPWWPTR